MSRARVFHVPDGEWFHDRYALIECCDCGLTHHVEWRIVDGRFESKWTRDEKETTKARRARKKGS